MKASAGQAGCNENQNKTISRGRYVDIVYRSDTKPTVEVAIDLYKRSTLGERRPIDRPDIFEGMIHHGNLTITAWHDGRLVGISRSLTDFTYVAYLSDLAVDLQYQRLGIGIELIKNTRALMGPESRIILLAAPEAVGYYPRIGFSQYPQAWILAAGDPFPVHA